MVNIAIDEFKVCQRFLPLSLQLVECFLYMLVSYMKH